MGLGDIYQEFSFLVKHGSAYSGVAITKGMVLKQSGTNNQLTYTAKDDEGFFVTALDPVEADATDRKLRVLVQGVVEVAVNSGFPIYFLDELITDANGKVYRRATQTGIAEKTVGYAMNYDILRNSGNVPMLLKR